MIKSNSPETITPSKAKRGRLIGGCLFILLLPILMGIYWIFIREVEPKENQLQFATPIPQAQLYQISEADSTLDFSILDGKVTGTIDVSGKDLSLEPAAEGGWLLRANVQLDGQSTDTGNAFMNFLLIEGLKAEEFPYGALVASTSETFPTLEDIQNHPMELVGDLEISGEIEPFTVPCTVTLNDGVVTVNATTIVDLADFGVSFPEQIGSSEMDVTIKVVAYLVEGGVIEEGTPADSAKVFG
jgi:polyisoprenoid-binding protein YceI